jgi:hypothetical protein
MKKRVQENGRPGLTLTETTTPGIGAPIEPLMRGSALGRLLDTTPLFLSLTYVDDFNEGAESWTNDVFVP